MLPAIKSILAGLTPSSLAPKSAGTASPASTPDVVKARVAKKQKELRRGTTKAEVQRVKTKLEAARVVLTQSERVDADEDSTAVMQRMTRAEEDVRDMERELTVAIRKDEAALADLKHAEHVEAVETEAAALAGLLALGPRGEEILAAVTQFSADMADAADALRLAGGNERYAYSVGEARAQWELFLGIAKRPPSIKGADSGAFRKYKNFTDCLEAICGMKERV